MIFSASGYIQPLGSGLYYETTTSGVILTSGVFFNCSSNPVNDFCHISSLGNCSLPSSIVFLVQGSLPNPIGLGPFKLYNKIHSDTLMVWQSDSIVGTNDFNFNIPIGVPYQGGVCSGNRNIYYGITDTAYGGQAFGCCHQATYCETTCNNVTNDCRHTTFTSIPGCQGDASLEIGNKNFTGHWTLTLDNFTIDGPQLSGCQWTGHLDFDVEQTLINGNMVDGCKVYRNNACVVNIANSGNLVNNSPQPSAQCITPLYGPAGVLVCSGIYAAISLDNDANTQTGAITNPTFNNLCYTPFNSFGNSFGNTSTNIFDKNNAPSGSRWVLNVM